MSQPSTSFLEVVQKCLAGGAAAALSKTTTAPIDRIKLVLQVQQGGSAAISKYNGISDCLSKISIEQGWLSLWRGNGAGVARCFPNHALNFALRDFYRNLFLRDIDRKKNFSGFLAGSLASGGCGGATTLFILYPFDFARTRLAVDARKDGTKKFHGMIDCLNQLRRKEGFGSWYKGLSASLQFVVASRALFFGLFDTIRNGNANPKQISFMTTWLTAQVCLITSGLICYPLDTVRRRLMIEVGKEKKRYGTTKNCWRVIAKSEGPSGFYKGAIANSLRSTGGALIITFYYEFSKYL